MSDPLDERSRVMRQRMSFRSDHGSDELIEWANSVRRWSYADDSDTYRIVDGSRGGLVYVEPDPEPIAVRPSCDRSGTCFDVESTEMRTACVDTIAAYLDADAVLHEVRHQRNGYHTDLVYADVDDAAVRERARLFVGDDGVHDPLQRFRVWWYVHENGPMTREKAVEDGRYSDAAKNRKHVEWLLQHGYLATNAAGALTAVVPQPLGELHAVELKRRDWETALEQAARARRNDSESLSPRTQQLNARRYGYADYAWVALDAGAIETALANLNRFEDLGVGLLGVAEGGAIVCHLNAEERPRGRYTRDRAWAESEVWNRVDVSSFIDGSEISQSKQATLVTDGGVR